jgi:para-aminobenzoate synthetase component I
MASRQSWWKEMNGLGAAGTPFIFLLDFELKRPYVRALSQVQSEELVFAVGGQTNFIPPPGQTEVPTSLMHDPVSFEQYYSAFEQVLSEIQYGNSFLCNLTIRTPIKSELNLVQVFAHSVGRYRVCMPGKFVCFSPETFVKITPDGEISSYPMKGTIDANLPKAEQELLQSEKELAEHYTIVDLIRNDLSLVARNVRVERFRYIEHVKTRQKDLLQASSEIKGLLRKNWKSSIGTMFKKLLPAGSISGAPKKKTIQIIRNAEQIDRGYYTGVCGIFDGKSLDSGVLIRFIEQDEFGRFWFRSGGGITCMSEAALEYAECNDKIYLPK